MKEILIAGIGMGSEALLTGQVKEAMDKADLVFGAERILDSARDLGLIRPEAQTVKAYTYGQIKPYLKGNYVYALVLMSGDSGFYSGAKKLYASLKEDGDLADWTIGLAPGISSVSYLAARCGVSYQDAQIISLHGKEAEDWKPLLVDRVRYSNKTFALSSGLAQLKEAADLLMQYLPKPEAVNLTLGYQLSYPEEVVETYSPETLIKESDLKEGLYTVLMENTEPLVRRIACGIRDAEFTRGKVPMTKQEVRHIAVDLLGLKEGAVLYDIGCGTGSVGIEAAMASPTIRVCGVDKNPEAVELTLDNAKAFGCANLSAVCGAALDFVRDPANPAPTHAFIGGSSGQMGELVQALRARNPRVVIVITAVTLESQAQIAGLMTGESDLIQMNISRTKPVGSYQMLQAENPISIVRL